MLLIDTVKIDHEKGICLTDCIKQPKDVLFFLNSQSDEEEEKTKGKAKKPPVKPLNGDASKNKVVGGKVLRNKTRSSAQEDVVMTTAARIADHQRELHAQRQRDGLAKYSEGGQGLGNKEGKGWKRFQSYKGEAGLPREVENLRVRCFIYLCFRRVPELGKDIRRPQSPISNPPCARVRGALSHQYDKKCK